MFQLFSQISNQKSRLAFVKIKKQKPELTRVVRPEGRAPTPFHEGRDQQEEERFPLPPGKHSANESHGRFVYCSPLKFLFSLHKSFLLPLPDEDLQAAGLGCRHRIVICC